MTEASTERPVLSGRYELHRRIARGGMADVFLARDQLLDRPVAVKVLFPQYAAEPTFVARFRREAQAAANLNHSSVVAVYDWGSHEDTYFIVMEYVEGRSLADVLAAEGHLYPDRAAEIATDVAAALGFAHRNGTVHRDVKPGNIMITPAGQVKVTDFGIARAFGGDDDELTQTGSVMGTASYFSPEQAQGKAVDPRSDLYSLGVVLFEMVTGEPPFSGASPVSIAYKHVQEQPPTASSLNPSVPAPLESIITRLLAKDPDMRYPAAEDVRAELRRFREGQPLVGVAQAAASAPVDGQTNAMLTQTGNAAPAAAPNGSRPGDTGSSRAIIDTTRAMPARAAVRQAEPVEEYYEPPSRTGVFVVMLAGLLLLLIGLIVYISNAISQPDGAETVAVETVRVPTVVGETERSAQNRLVDAGLVVKVEFAKNDDFEPGQVFEQNPSPGQDVGVGEEITIFIVETAEKITVPNVEALTREQANDELAAAGFLVTIERDSSDTVDEGLVISQSLEPNTEANKGANIILTISDGPEQKVVPNLTNVDTTVASEQLIELGFEVRIERESSGDVPAGSVIRTEPAAGSQVDVATEIKIFDSTGTAELLLPGLLNQSEEAARLELTTRGLVPIVNYVDVDPNSGQVGIVIAQNPQGGTPLGAGSTVTINVGRDQTQATQPPADNGADGGTDNEPDENSGDDET